MVNQELIRAIHQDRQRDIERAMRERALRQAASAASDVAAPGPSRGWSFVRTSRTAAAGQR